MKLQLTGKRTVIAVVLLAGVGLLYVQGSEERQQGNTSGEETTQCRIASKEDGVRVRSTPALDPANVVDELTAGEEADASPEIQNGFRKLTNGHWVSVEFTQVLEGRKC